MKNTKYLLIALAIIGAVLALGLIGSADVHNECLQYQCK